MANVLERRRQDCQKFCIEGAGELSSISIYSLVLSVEVLALVELLDRYSATTSSYSPFWQFWIKASRVPEGNSYIVSISYCMIHWDVAKAHLESQDRGQVLPFLARMRDGSDEESSRHDVNDTRQSEDNQVSLEQGKKRKTRDRRDRIEESRIFCGRIEYQY